MPNDKEELEILRQSNDRLASMTSTFERALNSQLDINDDLRNQIADNASDIADLVVENEILRQENSFTKEYLLRRGFSEADVEEFKTELQLFIKTTATLEKDV